MHSGDMTGRGTHEELWNFILWLEIQPYQHKVIIPGNHDWTLENNFKFWKDLCDKKGIHLLNDSGVTLDVHGEKIKYGDHLCSLGSIAGHLIVPEHQKKLLRCILGSNLTGT